jgi:hypothetical protein
MISQRNKDGVPLPYAILSLGISVTAFLVLGRTTRDYRYMDLRSVAPEPSSEIYNNSDRPQEGLSPSSWIFHEEDDEDDDEGEDEQEETETLESVSHFFLDLDKVPEYLIGCTSDVEELMEEVLEEFGSKLIAHTCRGSPVESIACLGILEGKGHISMYAWPQKGSVLLDLLIPDASFVMHDAEKVYEMFHPNMPNLFAPENAMANPVEPSTWFIRNRARSSELYESDYDDALASPAETKFKVNFTISSASMENYTFPS